MVSIGEVYVGDPGLTEHHLVSLSEASVRVAGGVVSTPVGLHFDYQTLKHSLTQPPDKDFAQEILGYYEGIPCVELSEKRLRHLHRSTKDALAKQEPS